jgi:hypothetical protein
MLIKKDDIEGLYGFGAVPRDGNAAMKRNNTHVLSLFAVALCAAVLTVVVAVLLVGQATASPLLNQTVDVPQTLGVAAIAAFGLATFACAVMLLMPVLISRKFHRGNRR